MKKMLSAMLALCLIIVLLPAVALPAQAASGGPEKTLQQIYYADVVNEVLLDESTTGVLLKDGSSNLVITIFPSRESEGVYTTFTTETGNVDFCFFAQTWNQVFYMYEADGSYTEADGFTKIGTATEGETLYLVLGWDQDGNKGGYKTTATAYKDGLISLAEGPGKMGYPVPVLNSKNEVCAIYYDQYCFSLATNEETFYGGSKGSQTEPPATEPPATEPPATEPPATQPPAAEAPENDKTEEYGMPVDLPELDSLYANAVVQKRPSNTGTIVLAGVAVLAVILLIAVVLVIRRKKMKINEDLNDAEEGTVLADVPMDTGLRLQFRNGKRIAVKRGFSIGRAPDNDIVIPKTSSTVSGRHCEILVQNGAVYLRDLGSTNGTFVNGKRLVTGQLVQLLPGMNVGLGGPNGPEMFNVTLSSK